MGELDEMFSNRQVVTEALAKAQEMAVQTDDGNGQTLTLEDQIELAKAWYSRTSMPE
ncbi:hypothetical protein CPTSoftv3_055 [Klebsiella phage Soft]|uniref:Uncharacterized protein n=1 Tax=Klebsiella phage Soft TaxID=2601626 RepID=A0A5C1K9E7_9CAUD|nr:hypothetical protein HWC61_gp55 [Klebsiella phage Soft]QEM42173.1 hypothetical protein CPTSoftv3_055 [Klebsiella phage Soft]